MSLRDMATESNSVEAILAEFISDPEKRSAAAAAVAAHNGASATSVPAIEGADVDLDRAARCGFPEVIFGEGKPGDLIAKILRTQLAAGQHGFVTRTDSKQASLICRTFPTAVHNVIANTVRVPADSSDDGTPDSRDPQVAVVSAGSCDAPVTQEAIETLHWMGVPSVLVEDVGVAGPQRLLKHVPMLRTMQVVVCVAGMEAALPSVLGGHVDCPVIGVPTSVGYGASFGGVTALLAMLTCCASNVVSVNIDAGFKGAYVAGIIARKSMNPSANRLETKSQNHG